MSDASAALQATQVSSDGTSISLVTGYPMLENDGELRRHYPDDDTIVTTIGVDSRMALAVAEQVQAAIDSDNEADLPVVSYEPWQVLA